MRYKRQWLTWSVLTCNKLQYICVSAVLLNTSGEESLSIHAFKGVLVKLLDKSLGRGTENNPSVKKS